MLNVVLSAASSVGLAIFALCETHGILAFLGIMLFAGCLLAIACRSR